MLRLPQVTTNYNNQKINIVQTLHIRINIYILVREKKKIECQKEKEREILNIHTKWLRFKVTKAYIFDAGLN